MKIRILKETGFQEAMLGLSLSYNKTFDYEANKLNSQPNFLHMVKVAEKLSGKGLGHDGFLCSIMVWIDITAPRYWWSQADRYIVGKTQLSESTMHTILKQPLSQLDFEVDLPEQTIDRLNLLIKNKDLIQIKNELPESFLQRRIVTTNYKTIRNMIVQRRNHKLAQWKRFCDVMLTDLMCDNLLSDLK